MRETYGYAITPGEHGFELGDGRELFRLDFKVRPKESHPLFWKSACGILTIWTFARDVNEARDHSLVLLLSMDFDLAGKDAQFSHHLNSTARSYQIVAEQAEMIGFSAIYEPYDEHADAKDLPSPVFPGAKSA
ncbi:MAG TPA: hypothetical protein VGG02_13835 [Chthoniobacterales bacterium]|jgi:hypothetical protein